MGRYAEARSAFQYDLVRLPDDKLHIVKTKFKSKKRVNWLEFWFMAAIYLISFTLVATLIHLGMNIAFGG